jgi:hypothetical protein
MMTNLLLTLAALMNGGWMLADGIHVLARGKYIGPEIPGPWRHLPEALGLDPLRLGPVFVIYGAAWRIALALFWGQQSLLPLAAIAILTLWYIPLGAALSAVTLILLAVKYWG